MSDFSRNCPNCNKILTYANKYLLQRAINKNCFCKNCAMSGKRNPMYGKTHSESALLKMSENSKGKTLGEKNGMFGLYGNDHPAGGKPKSEITKEKLREALSGIPKSESHKRKLRISAINDMNKKFGQIYPNYNKTACVVFENLNADLKLNGKHAENGGEYHITDLGYWVDYYEPDLNLVIEWDESYHDRQKEKDFKRETEIKKYLQCNFMRIKEKSFDYDKLKQNIKETCYERRNEIPK